MKSTIIYLVALVGFTNAATITLCADQSFGGTCTTFDANGCTNFPGNLNDKASFVDTGGPQCTFFVNGSCQGDSWTTSGRQNTVPGNVNDKLSSVRC